MTAPGEEGAGRRNRSGPPQDPEPGPAPLPPSSPAPTGPQTGEPSKAPGKDDGMVGAEAAGKTGARPTATPGTRGFQADGLDPQDLAAGEGQRLRIYALADLGVRRSLIAQDCGLKRATIDHILSTRPPPGAEATRSLGDADLGLGPLPNLPPGSLAPSLSDLLVRSLEWHKIDRRTAELVSFRFSSEATPNDYPHLETILRGLPSVVLPALVPSIVDTYRSLIGDRPSGGPGPKGGGSEPQDPLEKALADSDRQLADELKRATARARISQLNREAAGIPSAPSASSGPTERERELERENSELRMLKTVDDRIRSEVEPLKQENQALRSNQREDPVTEKQRITNSAQQQALTEVLHAARGFVDRGGSLQHLARSIETALAPQLAADVVANARGLMRGDNTPALAGGTGAPPVAFGPKDLGDAAAILERQSGGRR